MQLWDFSKELKSVFETAVVNEPSLFEPLSSTIYSEIKAGACLLYDEEADECFLIEKRKHVHVYLKDKLSNACLLWSLENADVLRFDLHRVRPRNAVGSASDSRVRGPGFDTRSGHILSSPFINSRRAVVSL